jgi:hypothetical protein
MNGLGLESFLIDSSLKSLVEELVDSKTKHVIELELFVAEQTITMHSVEEGCSFEQSTWIFLLESKQLSGSFSEVGEEQVHSPDFTLVLETVLSDKLKFMVNSLLLEGTTRSVEGGRMISVVFAHKVNI